MSIDDIANYCEVKDCQVSFGDAGSGFVRVDGTGIVRSCNNYRRFRGHFELAALPDPQEALNRATLFRIEEQDAGRNLTRSEFEQEIRRLQELLEG